MRCRDQIGFDPEDLDILGLKLHSKYEVTADSRLNFSYLRSCSGKSQLSVMQHQCYKFLLNNVNAM